MCIELTQELEIRTTEVRKRELIDDVHKLPDDFPCTRKTKFDEYREQMEADFDGIIFHYVISIVLLLKVLWQLWKSNDRRSLRVRAEMFKCKRRICTPFNAVSLSCRPAKPTSRVDLRLQLANWIGTELVVYRKRKKLAC